MAIDQFPWEAPSVLSTRQYEYRTFYHTVGDDPSEVLNTLGDEGWRWVGAVLCSNSLVLCYFMRVKR